MASKGGSRRQQLLDDPTIGRFNGHSIPRKGRTEVRPSKRRVGDPLAVSGDNDSHVGDLCAVRFHVPQPSSLRQVRMNGRVPSPSIKATVSRDGFGCEVVHGASDMSGFRLLRLLNDEGVRFRRGPRSRVPRWSARVPTSPSRLEPPRSTAPTCAFLALDHSLPPR